MIAKDGQPPHSHVIDFIWEGNFFKIFITQSVNYFQGNGAADNQPGGRILVLIYCLLRQGFGVRVIRSSPIHYVIAAAKNPSDLQHLYCILIAIVTKNNNNNSPRRCTCTPCDSGESVAEIAFCSGRSVNHPNKLYELIIIIDFTQMPNNIDYNQFNNFSELLEDRSYQYVIF